MSFAVKIEGILGLKGNIRMSGEMKDELKVLYK